MAVNLLSGRLLARNVIWNLAGAGLPLLVALWAIPILINGLGTERFGLLVLIWMGVGYFSLFDLGVGRALTKMVAERVGKDSESELPALVNTGLTLMVGLGVFAAISVLLISPWLVNSILNIPEDLKSEALWSFWVLGVSLPFVISTAGQIGILQAYQRFPEIAAVRIPLGVGNFLGPVLLLSFTQSLIMATAILVAMRILAWIAYWHMCRVYMGEEIQRKVIDTTIVKDLLAFGGWITVTNIVGPAMVYFDRFLIAALLSLTFVTFYTTPYEVITRLWIIPEALAGVLFPALTMVLASRSQRTKQFFMASARVLIISMFIPLAMVILFSFEGLAWWLGQEFAEESRTVLIWLSVGVFINSFARLPSIILQGAGRPDLNAKLHLAEFMPYLISLWWFIEWFGIVGAAIVWVLRIFVDFLGLSWLSSTVVPEMRREHLKLVALVSILSSVLAGLSLIDALFVKGFCVLFFVVVGGALMHRELLRISGYSHGAASNGEMRS